MSITDHPAIAAHIGQLAVAAQAWHKVAVDSPTALTPAWAHMRAHQRIVAALCIELGVPVEWRNITRIIVDATGNGDDVHGALRCYIADVEVGGCCGRKARPFDAEVDADEQF